MYALDRRKLATHVYSLIKSLRKAAIILQVSHTTVARWLRSPERKKYSRSCKIGVVSFVDLYLF